jgi:hypothetical protein
MPRERQSLAVAGDRNLHGNVVVLGAASRPRARHPAVPGVGTTIDTTLIDRSDAPAFGYSARRRSVARPSRRPLALPQLREGWRASAQNRRGDDPLGA